MKLYINLMQKSMMILFLSLTVFKSTASAQSSLNPVKYLVGMVPSFYFLSESEQNLKRSNLSLPATADLALIQIENSVIKKIEKTSLRKINLFQKENPNANIVHLKRPNQLKYDIVYPGLINLHNHPKQNLLPLWNEAKGQFANRYEWRDWNVYKWSVGQNMNPWLTYDDAVECATFRWAEIQSMVQGVTYIQGSSNCTNHFSILKVEDSDQYISRKKSAQSPTDLLSPQDMGILWTHFQEPVLKKGLTYEKVLSDMIKKYCPTLGDINEDSVNSDEFVLKLRDLNFLKKACNIEGQPEKFVRYLNWVHPGVAQKKRFMTQSPVQLQTGLITHIAEGRQDDEFNKKEFSLLKILGFVRPHVNLIHGVGLSLENYQDMKKNHMGLIWSPFSNLLLYGQTLKLSDVIKSEVKLALGSDWTPTGSKSVLEELKLAKSYILKDPDKENLLSIISKGTQKIELIDQWLYLLVTENPAQIINRAEIEFNQDQKLIEARIGSLVSQSMASIIVTEFKNENIFTNLIENVNEESIHAVFANGQIVYGSLSYLKLFKVDSNQIEIISNEVSDFSVIEKMQAVSASDTTLEGIKKHLWSVISLFKDHKLIQELKCHFLEDKAFVKPNTHKEFSYIEEFYTQTQLNLDSVKDIAKTLAVLSMNQSKNKLDATEGKGDYLLKKLAPIYTCNDESRMKRMQEFIKINKEDELDRIRKFRQDLIIKQKLGVGPKILNEKYSQ